MEKIYAFNLSTLAPSPFTTYGQLVEVIVKNAFVLASVISFIFLILGGFNVIVGAGGGDAKKMESAKQTITWAVAGLIIVMASYWLVETIGVLTGTKILK